MLLRGKYGAFRVLPHIARYAPIELSGEIERLIKMSKDDLNELVHTDEDESADVELGHDYIFDKVPHILVEGNDEGDTTDDGLDAEKYLRELDKVASRPKDRKRV